MSNILVIGGTGSLGRVLVPMICETMSVDRLRVLSRDEHKQIEMAETLKYPDKVDFFVGDVRDLARVKRASKDCEIIFHLAAVKSVDKAEYNPNEAVLTNVEGTRNVVDACLENGIRKAVFTSTDKAVNPINLYGASKLVGEKLFIQGNCYSGKKGTKFFCVRYGNVLGSNGSVIQKWKRSLKRGEPLKVTDKNMTRFFMTQVQAAQFVVDAVRNGKGGEVFVPKMKSTTVMELAYALDAMVTIEEIGVRPGEKQHETLISKDEVDCVTQENGHYVRWPHEKLFDFEVRGKSLPENILQEGFTSFNAPRFTQVELESLVENG